MSYDVRADGAMTAGRIVSVRIGGARDLARPDWDRNRRSRTWRSAYVKEEVAGPVVVGPLGLAGDEQFDRAVHGGPQMAVLAYPAAHYALWRLEPGLEAMGPGGFGENLTVEGFDESTTGIGDVFEAGSVRLQVASPRGPCANISRRWNAPQLLQRATETGRIGWYLRVLRAGQLQLGDTLTRTERPAAAWTVERVFRLRIAPASDPAAVRALAAFELLAPEWRELFAARAAKLSEKAI